MTIEQKKLSLIQWITNLQDDNLIDQVEDIRKSSLDDLPNEIVKMLHISDAENIEECIEHTTSVEILLEK